MTAWRKASGCHANGTCTEVARCQGNHNCVELAAAGHVAIRDSKNKHLPHLHLGRRAFGALLNGLKDPA